MWSSEEEAQPGQSKGRFPQLSDQEKWEVSILTGEQRNYITEQKQSLQIYKVSEKKTILYENAT